MAEVAVAIDALGALVRKHVVNRLIIKNAEPK
jgi:hypothetical protein